MKGLSITFSLTLSGCAALLALASATVSHAAVRTCTARIASIAAKDPTEQGAKAKAIDDWMLKAKGAGIDKPAWRLAASRSLLCQQVPGPDKMFECIAVGHACSISQVTPKPDRRGIPRPRGFGVDT